MKRIVPFLFLVSLCCAASGQTASDSEREVHRLMTCACLDGHDSQTFGRMGDATAVAITKIISGRAPESSEVDAILLILHISFADPKFVDIVSDREPRTAMFVLQYLSSTKRDPSLQARIDETKRYVQQQFAKSQQTDQRK